MEELMIFISSILIPFITDIVNCNIVRSKIRFCIYLFISIIFGTGIFFLQKDGNLLKDISGIVAISTTIYQLFYKDSDIRNIIK